MSLRLKECILLDNVVILGIHVMKVAGISPFNHFKCIKWCLILIAVRISSVTLLYKLQNATEKWYFGQQPKLLERLVLWYEFDCDGKFSHVKLLIKEKYSHTIITERYRFCCFKGKQLCDLTILNQASTDGQTDRHKSNRPMYTDMYMYTT